MTPSRSRLRHEVHSCWHSASQSEPPTGTPLPPSEEGVINQRSPDEWGNQMKKKETTLHIVFQNIGAFNKMKRWRQSWKSFVILLRKKRWISLALRRLIPAGMCSQTNFNQHDAHGAGGKIANGLSHTTDWKAARTINQLTNQEAQVSSA